jgi:hypothetical protein
LTGDVTKCCPFPHYTYLYSCYIGHHAKGYIWGFTPPRACYKLAALGRTRQPYSTGLALQVGRRAPSTLAAGDEVPMNSHGKRGESLKKGPKHVTFVASAVLEWRSTIRAVFPSFSPPCVICGPGFLACTRPAYSSAEARGWLLTGAGPGEG